MKSFKISNAGACDKVLSMLRLTTEDHAIILELSKKHKISMQEVARQMIQFAIENMERLK